MSKPKVAFTANTETEGAELLKEFIKENAQFFELVAATEKPQYFFKISDQSFQLVEPNEESPVFKKVQGLNRASAIDFLAKTITVTKWFHAIELSNPTSSIQENEFKIDFFKIDQPGNFEDNASASEVDWRSPTVFSYEKVEDEWKKPAFRLKITNTGNRPLWVHSLYLGNDFSITDRLLSGQELKPGEEMWLTDISDEASFKTISLQVEGEYLNQGISEIKELIKIFISTEELAIHRFNQEGVQQDVPSSPKRGIDRLIQLSAPNWVTREIELIIKKPVEETTVPEIEEEISEPDAIPPAAPAPSIISPPPEASVPPPKSGSPSVAGKLKKWFRGLKKSKSNKTITFPTRSRRVEQLDDDFEKVYPELGPELEDTAPPPSEIKRSMSSKLDEMLEKPDSHKTELPDALKSDDNGNQVDCSVYAPPAAQKGDDVFIQVWLHLPQLSQQAKTMALEFDDEAGQRAFQSLKIPLEKGDELSLVLEGKGIDIDENVQHITWNGNIQSAQFIASIPEDFARNKGIFTLRLFRGELPIGHIKFILKIVSESVEIEAQPLATEAKRYKKAFISYSSKDRNEVLKRVQMLDKVGIKFFQDVLTLNAGERWEQKLYENINDADVFFLFWSSAAKESQWVLKELEYAIKLKHGNEDNPPLIQPVPIEGPPIVSPPEQLGHMHFNDKILYFILKK